MDAECMLFEEFCAWILLAKESKANRSIRLLRYNDNYM